MFSKLEGSWKRSNQGKGGGLDKIRKWVRKGKETTVLKKKEKLPTTKT